MSIINTAINASILAGEKILKIYNDPDSDFSVEEKADNSPLTIADKTGHQVIKAALIETGIPILSEEGKIIEYKERKTWDTFWLTDLSGELQYNKENLLNPYFIVK